MRYKKKKIKKKQNKKKQLPKKSLKETWRVKNNFIGRKKTQRNLLSCLSLTSTLFVTCSIFAIPL